MIVDYLFSFPIVMIDGDKEDKNDEISRLINKAIDSDVEIIYGEASCHYEDFVSVMDRWLPTDSSYNNALNGRFDACQVIFSQSGGFLVPLKKSEFIAKFTSFLDNLEQKEDKDLVL